MIVNKAEVNRINLIKAKQRLREQHLQAREEYDSNPRLCKCCNKPLPYSKRNNTFCNSSCSTTFNNKQRTVSDETKQKIRESRSAYVSQQQARMKPCEKCGTPFLIKWNTAKNKYCSSCLPLVWKENGSRRGKLSAAVQRENRRSKNEILFATMCIEHFLNVQTNAPIFNGWDADVIVHDIKVAVLWNGVWHTKKITKQHSVEQVQNRDKIKLTEIQKAGYTSYVVNDPGSYNPAFVKQQFEQFIGQVV